MAPRFALLLQRKLFCSGLQIDPLWDEQQVVGVTREKRRVERDIGRPVGRRHSVIEENAEHPIAKAGETIVDGRAIAGRLVAGLDHQHRAMPVEDGGCSVEDSAARVLRRRS